MIRVWNERAYKGSAKETQADDGFSKQSSGQTLVRSFRPLPIERLGTYIRGAGLSGYGDKLPM